MCHKAELLAFKIPENILKISYIDATGRNFGDIHMKLGM